MKQTPPQGHLDLYRDNNILGWLSSNHGRVLPFVTVNGIPCNLLAHSIVREDVATAMGLPAEAGFIAELPLGIVGAAECKLYAIAESGQLTQVDKKIFTVPGEPAQPQVIPTAPSTTKNIVLIWKQHDAGLYGRRIDQVARALAASKDGYQVVVLEILNLQQVDFYKAESYRTDSDKQFIYEDIFLKQTGAIKEGVIYKNIIADEQNKYAPQLNDFIKDYNLARDNTAFIVFPAITDFSQLMSSLNSYPIICDIVDNQLPWNKQDPFSLLSQYASLCATAVSIIFNSDVNRNFFVSRNLANKEKSKTIKNWYRLPSAIRQKKLPKENSTEFNILYSGNMNDRIDWHLLHRLHDETANNNSAEHSVIIHLVGSADTANAEIALLSQYPRIKYHGPMREKDLLHFAQKCNLAIMPHRLDEVSSYMNPLKLHMYAELELKCISTMVPGVNRWGKYLTICNDHETFIKTVKRHLKKPRKTISLFSFNKNKYVKMYLHEVKKVFNTL